MRKSLSYIAGVDAAFDGELVMAVASLFAYPSLLHEADAVSQEKVIFPYVPGFLSYREGHALISAIRKLRQTPDVIIVDGQGIAHPRGFGLASHLGLWFDIPSIGCAKTSLFGDFINPGPSKGSFELIRKEGRELGAVLRTKEKVKPL